MGSENPNIIENFVSALVTFITNLVQNAKDNNEPHLNAETVLNMLNKYEIVKDGQLKPADV